MWREEGRDVGGGGKGVTLIHVELARHGLQLLALAL